MRVWWAIMSAQLSCKHSTFIWSIISSRWGYWNATLECQICVPTFASVRLHRHSHSFKIELVTHLEMDPTPNVWGMHFSRTGLGYLYMVGPDSALKRAAKRIARRQRGKDPRGHGQEYISDCFLKLVSFRVNWSRSVKKAPLSASSMGRTQQGLTMRLCSI